MRRTTVPAVFAAVILAPIASASIDVTEASRSLQVWAAGHDWEFDELDMQSDETTATSGAFAPAFQVDLDDYDGVPVATGIGAVDSMLGAAGLSFTLTAEGLTDDAPVYQSDGGGEAEVLVRFDLAAPTRIVVDGAAGGDGAYAWGYAHLRRDEPGPALAVVGFEQGLPEAVHFDDVLDAGSYVVDAFIQAWVFGGNGITAEAGGFVDFSLGAFDLADVDRSGAVDVGDLVAVILAWGTDDDDADVDRSGTVGVGDLVAVVLAWA